MKRTELPEREHLVLTCIAQLPAKMLEVYDRDNLLEFVMHDLCYVDCFDFNKAAYFIDNPDFNCIKGLVGFSKQEAFDKPNEIWHKPDDFSQHMSDADFNKSIRNIWRCSLKKERSTEEQMAKQMAQELGFKDFGYCSWKAKNDNHGLFVFEPAEKPTNNHGHNFLHHAVRLLSFCPIF